MVPHSIVDAIGLVFVIAVYWVLGVGMLFMTAYFALQNVQNSITYLRLGWIINFIKQRDLSSDFSTDDLAQDMIQQGRVMHFLHGVLWGVAALVILISFWGVWERIHPFAAILLTLPTGHIIRKMFQSQARALESVLDDLKLNHEEQALMQKWYAHERLINTLGAGIVLVASAIFLANRTHTFWT